jgi:hypothetical protein
VHHRATHRRLRRVLPVLAALCIAACSSTTSTSGSTSAAGNPATTVALTGDSGLPSEAGLSTEPPADTAPAGRPAPTTTTPAPAGQDVAADRALATKALLTATDFPDAWTGHPRDTTGDSPAAQTAFAACLGVKHSPLAPGPTTVSSPDFVDADGNSVANTIQLKLAAADAKADFALMATPKLANCLTALIGQQLIQSMMANSGAPTATDAEFGTAALQELPAPAVGSAARAFEVTVPLSTKEGTQNVYADLVLFAQGRAEVMLEGVSIANPSPPGLLDALAKAIAARLPPA